MTSDFMYEYQVNRCPITDEQAAAVLGWLGISVRSAKEWCCVTSSAAVLVCVAKDFKRKMDPPVYVSPCGDTGR